jgi:aminoglycoside 6'-N-acetyltransferase
MPASPTLTFRPAVPADAPLLRRWDDEPHVVASDPNDDWRWEIELAENPEWREQFIAELDGRPIGFLQIIDPAREEAHYWGDAPLHLRALDIWIGEADCLNHGYGTRMMHFAINRCFADPAVTGILIDPLEGNLAARRFYERLGFKPVGPRRFGHDDCMVYSLSRDAWRAKTAE